MVFIKNVTHCFNEDISQIGIQTDSNGCRILKWGHSGHPHPHSAEGLNLLPNFQKGGGLTRPQFLDEVAGKKGMTFFRGKVCSF